MACSDDDKKLQELKALWKAREERFKRSLAEKELGLKEMEGDGNCLFRAVAD
jgi:hypothetical protein